MRDSVFSPSEQKILAILGRKRMTLTQITEKFYKGWVTTHLDASVPIASAIRRINRKCEKFHMGWKLAGEGTGRHGKTVWREKV